MSRHALNSVPSGGGHDRSTPSEPFEELARVTLSAEVRTDDGRVLPAGAKGTVVGVYRKGAAYEVEFTKPFHVVATLLPGSIAR